MSLRAATPADRLSRAVGRVEPEWFALVVLVTTWIVVFGRLAVLRQERYGSFSLDMGIFDQATWLISRADGLFMSVRGLHFFGHHANLGLFLLAPFYRLGAGPNFLNLTMVVSMGLGALPVFLLARDRLRNGWLAVGLGAAYLLHPSLQFMAWELFHPDTMAILPLLFGWWLARRERWGWFAVCMVYATCWKEDVALAVFVVGLVLLLRRQWTPGLLTAGLSLAWFLIVNNVMLAHLSGAGQAFYNDTFFGSLGNTPTQVAINGLKHPTEITRRVFAADSMSFYWKMTAPFAFVPLAAPGALAIGLPQTLVNVLTIAGFTRVINYHYAALPLTALTLAAVEGVAFLGRQPLQRRVLVGVIVVCSVVGSVLWGPSPIGAEYRKGWWPPAGDTRLPAKREAVRRLAGRDHISATYNLVPHLSHRRFIYSYPNPFIADNWAVNGENLPDPNVVHYLAVDRQLVGGGVSQALLDRLLSDGEFVIEWQRDDVFIARRAARGTRVSAEGLGFPSEP